MKFRWLPAAICCATFGLYASSPSLPCYAQGAKPQASAIEGGEDTDESVVVVALSPLDSLIGNLQHLARTAGAGAAAGGLSTAINQYAGGLDRTRPIGVFVDIDENGQPSPIGCLPIEDLQQFFDQLSIFGEATDLGDGLYEISLGNPIYAKKIGQWLYVAQSEDALSDIDGEMASGLAKMVQKYDLRIQLNPQNIPDELVEFIIGQMEAGMEQSMAAQAETMDEEDEAAARAASEQMIAQMQEAIESTEKVVVGLSVNKQEKRTLIDVGTQFVEDSKFAKQVDKLKAAKASQGGVPRETSAITLQTFQVVENEDLAQLETSLDTALKSAFKAIDEKAEDPAAAARAKEIVGKVVDILVDSAKQGKLESALEVATEKNLNVVGSVGVADGAKVEALVGEVAKEFATSGAPAKFELNTGKHGGANLHKISIKLPPQADEAARKIFGDSVTISVATAPKAVYVALGKDCEASVKTAIDRTASKPSSPAESLKLRVVMSQLLAYAQTIQASPVAEAMLNVASSGNDRITIDSQPVERGVVVRIAVEEGVIKAVAAGVKAGQGNGGF